MKKIITSTFLLLGVVMYAQDGQESQGFDAQKELERQVKIPNTPEAQAFEKYGNTSVSMYTGAPNISVPIYTIAGRELNVPMSLTYDATGVKVNQMATQVGLSWNLHVGGRISRTVNGLLDDYINSSPGYHTLGNPNNRVGGTNLVQVYNGKRFIGKTLQEWVALYKNPPSTFNSKEDAKQYFSFLKDLADNKFDTQPDYFSFNALGYSDTFVYDPEEATFVALKNPRTKVTANYSADGSSLESWIVTTDDGTKFYFEEAEQTHKQADDTSATAIALQNYNSSWVLTKIISAHSKDTYLFSYKSIAKTDQESYHISSVTNNFQSNGEEVGGQVNYVGVSYDFKAKVLEKITHNGHEIVTIGFKNRADQSLADYNTNGSAIDVISIHKRHENGVLKKFRFFHSYFGDLSNLNHTWKLRLKLDKIDIQSGTNNTLSSYTFEYITPEQVPARTSFSQDYLGLYNGANNSVLYAALPFSTALGGANRSPNFNYAKIGLLSRIIYPTGGHTIFDYEPHTIPLDPNGINGAYPLEQHAIFSINGGVDNNNAYMQNTCMIAIDEDFSLLENPVYSYGLPPVIGTTNFKVTEAGSYRVDLEKISSARGIEAYEAYIVKRSTAIDLAANDTYSYDEIIDVNNCTTHMPLLYNKKEDGHQKNLFLEEGTYQILLVKGIVKSGTRGTQNSLRLTVNKFTGNLDGALEGAPIVWLGTGEQAKAGIRVKSIKDYSAENVLATEKEYKYTVTVDGNDSTGREVFKPIFSTTNHPQEDGGITTVTQHSFFSNGDRPHVAYHRVFEIQKVGGTNNGYQVHDFNVGRYNGVSNDYGANLYHNDFKVGKENILSIFNREDVLKAQNKTDYTDVEYYSYSTLYPFQNLENQNKFVLIKEDLISGTWRYSYIPPVYIGMSTGENPNPSLPQSIAQQPDECKASRAFCFYPEYATLALRIAYAKGRTGGELLKKSRQFYDNKTHANQTAYSYYNTGSNPNYLLKETENTTSEGDVIKQQFFYPESGALKSANILNTPIETKTFKNEELLSNKKTHYSGILPTKIQTSKGESALEDRLIFEQYIDRNLVQVQQADGTHIVYIWGYQQTQPIAKIVNATYNQVASYVSNLQRLSNLDNDRTLAGAGNEGALRTALNNLRTVPALSNAQITTYTYDPLIGVTSITDASGQVVYYQYDAHHRLQFVKDKDGNILKENQYNYKH